LTDFSYKLWKAVTEKLAVFLNLDLLHNRKPGRTTHSTSKKQGKVKKDSNWSKAWATASIKHKPSTLAVFLSKSELHRKYKGSLKFKGG
jgi:hypothetical protein